MSHLNETHEPSLKSWVVSANQPDNGFPIQNLPFGVFREKGGSGPFRIGVAIGDKVLDLTELAGRQPWSGFAAEALAACQAGKLNGLMALGQSHWSALRLELSRALREGSASQAEFEPLLVDRDQIEHDVPAHIGDYTDFYISVHHATAVGKQFRPDNPLLPNYKWVPIGYHGRASTIGVSGQAFPRPVGQTRPAAEGEAPNFGACQRLDYELELGIFVGPGNKQGQRINIEDAESHIFGFCILNDWSARDLQAWEYQPLGPFLSKNFASTISPWVVTLEALAPFREAFQRPSEDPQPMPYLSSPANSEAGAFNVQLEVLMTTEASRRQGEQPARLSSSNFRDAYWTAAQLVTHHSVNGCALQAGDFMGTGTLSGPTPEAAGSLLELTGSGQKPITLPWGEQRGFLEDHDEIILRAHCSKPGYPTISLGECAGTVLPAV